MAIYFPPILCAKGSILRALKDFEVEFEDNKVIAISTGDRCFVIDVIGYGFNIKKENSKKEFRLMNSSILDYFEIIEKVEPNFDLDNIGYNEDEANLITLDKDFEIESVIKIPAGERFIHFVDTNSNEMFHDLFSVKKEKVLRMKGTEFEKYFKK